MLIPQIISNGRIEQIIATMRSGERPNLEARDIWGMINRIEQLEREKR